MMPLQKLAKESLIQRPIYDHVFDPKDLLGQPAVVLEVGSQADTRPHTYLSISCNLHINIIIPSRWTLNPFPSRS